MTTMDGKKLTELDSPLSNSLYTKTPEKTQAYYDQWAANYDQDVKEHDYNGPKYTMQLLEKYVDKNSLTLCIGAGTGLEADLIYRSGWTKIHVHDGSQKMLDIAAARGIFEECIFELMYPNKQSGFRGSYYDCMICVGCFVPGGLDERYVEDMLRTLKPGGVAILGTREVFVTDPGEPFDYHFNLDQRIHKLCEKGGPVQLLERTRFERYSERMPGVFYVLRKL